MSARNLRRIMNLWPPFLFCGIRVLEIGDDWRYARVVLRKRWYNRNYVGTQYGGSLFSMTDPFWMLLTLRCLGPGFIVWDQAAAIDFVAPGREDVHAEFCISDAMLEDLRAATVGGEKCLRWYEAPIRTSDGQLIATVRKQLYVRRKRSRPVTGTLRAQPAKCRAAQEIGHARPRQHSSGTAQR
ncbi:DUF4442 domain-containing protein [Dokdonella sp.]|uniref:DUF4442 domain-containing protein n=1 Tax=Dokdonella sp. TaxID=2291710 RepID=UPI003AF4B554